VDDLYIGSRESNKSRERMNGDDGRVMLLRDGTITHKKVGVFV
jgi:hypothetical protein